MTVSDGRCPLDRARRLRAKTETFRCHNLRGRRASGQETRENTCAKIDGTFFVTGNGYLSESVLKPLQSICAGGIGSEIDEIEGGSCRHLCRQCVGLKSAGLDGGIARRPSLM